MKKLLLNFGIYLMMKSLIMRNLKKIHGTESHIVRCNNKYINHTSNLPIQIFISYF
jgi:hypothetical protein